MLRHRFIDQLPAPLPTDPNALVRQFSDAHDDLRQRIDTSIEEIVMSHRITEAEGRDLDAIGDSFGRIGERRGRGDEQYRAFLLSIVPSFSGRGTPTGLRFAIAAGVRAQDSDITIHEHFDENAYSVTVGDWIGHRPTTVHEMADLADPSGVELLTPVTYNYEKGVVVHSASDVRSGLVITIPAPAHLHSATDSEVVDERAGFGAGRFDGEGHLDGQGRLDIPDDGDGEDGSTVYGEGVYGEGYY